MLYLVIIIAAIIMCLMCFWKIHRKKVNQTIRCSEGQFSIHGAKQCFTIKKDTRFAFIVENGQIVAVKDNSASSKQIEYRRD